MNEEHNPLIFLKINIKLNEYLYLLIKKTIFVTSY